MTYPYGLCKSMTELTKIGLSLVCGWSPKGPSISRQDTLNRVFNFYAIRMIETKCVIRLYVRYYYCIIFSDPFRSTAYSPCTSILPNPTCSFEINETVGETCPAV